MKVLLVDDEPAVARSLIDLIARHCKKLSVDYLAENLQEAKRVVSNSEVNLIFLDLHLPDGNGLQLAEYLSEDSRHERPAIIVTTAHEGYALEAIKANVVDYLLKPIDPEELVEAVQKAEQVHKLEHQTTLIPLNKIALFTAERVELVEISKIIRCQSSNNYTTFYIEGGRNILISKPLKDVERTLESNGFYRVHQSHLINLSHISSFEKQGLGYLTLTDGQQILVSATYKAALMEQLRKLSI